MLLLDGQVHHDTHAIPMGNYVIGVGNYVIATPSQLGNYKIADIFAYTTSSRAYTSQACGRAKRWNCERRSTSNCPTMTDGARCTCVGPRRPLGPAGQNPAVAVILGS